MSSVLVIDDEQPTLIMFSHMLGAYGYSVLTATSGEEGLEIFKKEKPPIVVTDIKMPQMDGIEVLRQIKALAPQTEVIVITGHGDMDLAIQSLNLDATDFINKPIQRKALEQAFNRAEERLRLLSGRQDAIRVHSKGQAAVIRIQGIINAASETEIVKAYQDAAALKQKKILISLHESASVNGAGLAILAQLLLAAKKENHRVRLVAPSMNFRKVFEIVGISKLVSIYDSEQAALESSDID